MDPTSSKQGISSMQHANQEARNSRHFGAYTTRVTRHLGKGTTPFRAVRKGDTDPRNRDAVHFESRQSSHSLACTRLFSSRIDWTMRGSGDQGQLIPDTLMIIASRYPAPGVNIPTGMRVMPCNTRPVTWRSGVREGTALTESSPIATMHSDLTSRASHDGKCQVLVCRSDFVRRD
jgi:hypothetical protein